MLARLKIPVSFYLCHNEETLLNASLKFSYDKLGCLMNFQGDNILTSEDLPDYTKFFKHINFLAFTVEEGPESNLLDTLISSCDWKQLVELFVKVANKCIRLLRYIGHVSNLHELNIDAKDDCEIQLRKWSAEISSNGDEWKDLVPTTLKSEMLIHLLAYNQTQQTSNLFMSKWSDIESVMGENGTIPQEQEFVVNAMEHINLKNYRLALLESVIGLEIALTQYLHDYLLLFKGLSSKRIESFLSPSLGLTARLSVMLDLTFKKSELKLFDLTKVLTAVNWRNKVTHSTGNIPKGVSEKQIIDCITQIFILISMLGNKIRQLNNVGQLNRMKKGIPNIFDSL